MSAAANLKLVQEIYQAFGRGDIPAVLEHCADDIDWGIDAKSGVPWHGLGKGKAFAARFFETIARESEITRFEPHTFIAGDDGVACLVRLESKLRKTGKTVAMEDIHLFKIQGGRVTLWRGSEDTAQVLAAWNG
jgi:ketosteroid isomerase-like protein